MNRTLEMQRKRQKEEKKKDMILFILITIGLVLMIFLAMKLGQNDMKNCIKAGHSVKYCERGL